MPEYKKQEGVDFSFVKNIKYVFPLGIFKEEVISDYGRYVFSPLERGFGHTIGNVIRRVLLSSIPGYAIVGVRIEGVPHEFSSIDGVYEDVTNIILNLKQVRVKFDNEVESTALLRLVASEKREYKAKDIECPHYVEIVNPEQHLFTVTGDDVNLNFEFLVVRGRGYVPAEEIQLPNLPVDYIIMDGIFSPVTKVNFTVENIRVKARTDFEKLTLEIWTDGTVSPDHCLKYAVDLILDLFSRFQKEIEEPFKVEEEKVPSEKKLKIKELLEEEIDILELPRKTLNILKDEGITKIKELVTLNREYLFRFKNLGEKSIKEIEDKLAMHELHFGMNIKEFE